MKSQYLKTGIESINGRRDFLKLAGYGALGLIAGGYLPMFSPSAYGLTQQVSLNTTETVFKPDLDLTLVPQAEEVAILPGSPTRVWRYHATVNQGDSNRVVEIPESYLGPIINARQGEKIRIRFKNDIPEKSIIHWHGLHVPAIMDGHPRYAVAQGRSYLYEFTVTNRAGTYWYHPHPHGRTGFQVYGGLAGLFLVSDEEELGAGLPENEFDIPLVIQDRTFDAHNQLVYMSRNRMARMTGFLGDRILVNGKPDFTLPVSTTAYRLRLLNGSNSRIYRLAWQDGRPLTIIATDGGLLEKPVQRQFAFLAPGERMELWADFSDNPVGYETGLISLPFDGAGTGRGRMMGTDAGLPLGAGFSVFKLKVSRKVNRSIELPQKLSEVTPVDLLNTAGLGHLREFYLTMGHMQWSINGRTFQMEDVTEDEIVKLGSKEIWEFNNTGGGMMRMMNMPHPIHLHGKQFRVVGRSGVRHDGYVDEGWKDTVLLMPGERVRILTEFSDYPGLFLYHCHNLEHEDMGMMRNYFVQK